MLEKLFDGNLDELHGYVFGCTIVVIMVVLFYFVSCDKLKRKSRKDKNPSVDLAQKILKNVIADGELTNEERMTLEIVIAYAGQTQVCHKELEDPKSWLLKRENSKFLNQVGEQFGMDSFEVRAFCIGAEEGMGMAARFAPMHIIYSAVPTTFMLRERVGEIVALKFLLRPITFIRYVFFIIISLLYTLLINPCCEMAIKLLRLRAFLKLCVFCTTDEDILKFQAVVKNAAVIFANRSQEVLNREDVQESLSTFKKKMEDLAAMGFESLNDTLNQTAFKEKVEELAKQTLEHGSNALKHEHVGAVTGVAKEAAAQFGKRVASVVTDHFSESSGDVDEDIMRSLIYYTEILPRKFVEFGVYYADALNAYLKHLLQVFNIDDTTFRFALHIWCCAGIVFGFGRLMCGMGTTRAFFILFVPAAAILYKVEDFILLAPAADILYKLEDFLKGAIFAVWDWCQVWAGMEALGYFVASLLIAYFAEALKEAWDDCFLVWMIKWSSRLGKCAQVEGVSRRGGEDIGEEEGDGGDGPKDDVGGLQVSPATDATVKKRGRDEGLAGIADAKRSRSTGF